MVRTIEIPRTGGRAPSRVAVGDALGLLPEVLPRGRRVVAVTDPNVDALYGDAIRQHAGDVIVIPTGEENKTLATVEAIHSRLIELGADRSTYILGFGGGIVTDVTGFAASTYMRGVGFGFVATTLLAQVDASVGGKNGVNVGGYKNMAGVFSQPDFVLCDAGVLRTLPEREFRAGLAEMLKAGIIADPELFATLESRSPEQLMADSGMLAGAIAAAIRVKARIVEADETERGERRKLNLGHTVAHAVEKLTRRFNHGEAVGIGLVAAADISVKLGLLAAADRDRVVRAVERVGLPTASGIHSEEIAHALTRDKKVEGGDVWLVVVRGVGEVEMRQTPLAELAELLS